jgi:hypothetical protein
LAGPWQPFDASALHQIVAKQKIVFVNVAAA